MASVQMTVQDELWLTMDRPNNLMVVDGAIILRGAPSLDDVRGIYEAMVQRFPVFTRRAVQRGRNWVWEDHPGFSVADHVTDANLAGPATVATVQRFLSEQRSLPLPLDRPRWAAYLMSDVTLPDGAVGAAVVCRFHHAIADGVRLTQVMLGMCDGGDGGLEAKVARTAAGSAANPVSAFGEAISSAGQGAAAAVSETVNALRHPIDTAHRVPLALRQGVESVGDVATRAVDATRISSHGVAGGFELLRHPDRLLDALEVLGVANHRSLNDLSSITKLALASSPRTVWSGRPGTVKSVSWCDPIPLSDIKAIGKQRGVTVNDVLLAAVAGALRRYLLEHGGLVDEVYWMVPVNLKPFAENLPPELGNYFALVFLPMALHHTDRESRLSHMHQVMQRIKHSDEAVLTFGLQQVVSQSPGQVAFFLTNFFANKAVGVLTNVPGPASALTFGGHPVHQIVGFAPCSGDHPMTATIFSYNGGVTVGFASDTWLVPDPEVLVGYVVAEVQQLAAAAR